MASAVEPSGRPAKVQAPEGARVIDVRTPGEYFSRPSQVTGAELVPLADLPLRAGSWARDRALVVVCDDGHRSRLAVAWLRNHGFQAVRALEAAS